MAKTPSEDTSTDIEHHHHHVGRHVSHGYKHLVKADGRRVYIGSNPVEAEEIRRALSEHDADAEFVVHGSDEHISTLRHVHSVHLERRAAFHQRHGEHFTELENAIREMDTVREELHGLEARVIQLDAAAEKYGYDSHVRFRDHPTSHKSALNHQSRDFEKERQKARSMTFAAKPTLRQYYHKGLLWRANTIHEPGAYELFIDLVYVGVIALAGDAASEEASGHSLLRFAVTFLMGWKFWAEIAIWMAWFVQEDVVRRISVIFVLTCLVGFTINMDGFFSDTYTALVAFYVAAALMSAFSWLIYASLVPMIRGVLISNAVALIVSVALWIGSIHDHTNGRYALVWTGLFIDIVGFELKWVAIFGGQKAKNERVKSWFLRKFEYVPGMSVEYMVCRYDAFVTLVLGYSVVSLLYQSAAANPMNNFFAKAILGLLQAFAMNSIYFEMDSFNLYTHAIRRHNRLFFLVWKMTHIPFVMSFVVAGATISRLVLAHDCQRCPVSALAESYIPSSQATVSQGQRWFYCAGLGISLLCTVVIASMHLYKRADELWFLRHRQACRLGLRALVGCAIVLLPLAGDRLDSLCLVATTAGLLHLVLFTEIAGNALDARLCPKHRRELGGTEHVVHGV